MTLNEFAVIIFMALALVLVAAVIFYLRKITNDMNEVRSDIHNLVQQVLPVIDNIEKITVRANRIASEAENYWDEIDRSIKNLKEKVSNLTSMKLIRDVENPAKNLIRNLRAFSRGISTFWSEFSK